MSGILILGAGGHGKVIADILLSSQQPVIGFLDDEPSLWGNQVLGLPVLGAMQDFERYQPAGLVAAIGNNAARDALVRKLGDAAQQLWVRAQHPAAIVALSAQVGHGTVLMAGAVVNPDAVIGDHVIVNTGATIDHDCRIEDFAHVAPGAHLAGGVVVGARTLIGVGASVIPYQTIGQDVIIGAGATVVRTVPDAVMAKGTPARW